jgi:putative thioredoxin
VNVTNFQDDVIEASKERPVLVDFWAPWCGPCRMLGPILEKLEGEGRGAWRLAKVNTDENPAVATRYRISSIPAVKLFVDGEVAAEFIGALPEARVRDWLEENVPSEVRKLIERAEALLDEGIDAEAESILAEVLSREPENPDALLLQSKLLLFGDSNRAAELARRAGTAKAGLYKKTQAVETIARLITLSGEELPSGKGRDAYAVAIDALKQRDLDTAISRLVEVVRLDRQCDDDGARRACIALFALLGDQHAVTQKHRRAFQMAVF